VLEQSAAHRRRAFSSRAGAPALDGARKEPLPDNGRLAEVLYTARNHVTRKIVVDKGLTHSIQSGLPVIDATGVVGQVTRRWDVHQRGDARHGEGPVGAGDAGAQRACRAVAVDRARTDRSTSRHARSADVVNGDMFVTSGIDGLTRRGLVVALVTSVEKNAAYVFAKIVARPAPASQPPLRDDAAAARDRRAPPGSKADEQPRKSGKDRGAAAAGNAPIRALAASSSSCRAISYTRRRQSRS